MTTLIYILIAVLGIGLGVGATAWYFLRRRQQTEKSTEVSAAKNRFRWRYIAAPVVLLLLFVILSAIFYPRLPAEVGYQFRPDGTAGKLLSREMAMVLMLVPQLFLALLALFITKKMARMEIFSGQQQILGIKPQKILTIVGNLGALPQLILRFTIFDIFSYNACQVHIMPVWVAILVLALSAVVLGAVFVIFVYRSRERLFNQPEDKQ